VSTDGFHLVFLFSFNNHAGQRDIVRAKLRGFFVQGEERSVEDAMYFPSWREAKVVGVRGNDLRDLEWTFLSRGQFSGREIDLQVSRVKPYLRSYFPRGKLCSYSFLDSLSSLCVSSRSLFSSSIEEFELFVKGREEHFPDHRVSSGLEAHHERERCLVGDGVSGRVVRKLGHGQKV